MADRVYRYEVTVFNALDCEIERIYCDDIVQLQNAMFNSVEMVEDGDRYEIKVNEARDGTV